MKKDYALPWRALILLIFLILSAGLTGCAHKSLILTESEMRPIIKRGTTYKAVWDGREQELIAEADRITLPLGTYIELQAKCK